MKPPPLLSTSGLAPPVGSVVEFPMANFSSNSWLPSSTSSLGCVSAAAMPPPGLSNGDSVKATTTTGREALCVLHEISTLLGTGLDRELLEIVVQLCELGVSPVVLAEVVNELRCEVRKKLAQPKNEEEKAPFCHNSRVGVGVGVGGIGGGVGIGRIGGGGGVGIGGIGVGGRKNAIGAGRDAREEVWESSSRTQQTPHQTPQLKAVAAVAAEHTNTLAPFAKSSVKSGGVTAAAQQMRGLLTPQKQKNCNASLRTTTPSLPLRPSSSSPSPLPPPPPLLTSDDTHETIGGCNGGGKRTASMAAIMRTMTRKAADTGNAASIGRSSTASTATGGSGLLAVAGGRGGGGGGERRPDSRKA